MQYWQREVVRKFLEQFACWVKEAEPGGDYDITGFSVTPHGSTEWISVCPFKDPDEDPDAEVDDLCDIYAVEVRTNGDCEGGLQTEDGEVGALYGRICAGLERRGFYVIPHYDRIF